MQLNNWNYCTLHSLAGSKYTILFWISISKHVPWIIDTDISMLMNTQHMVASNDYRFTPVGGRVCKETDPAATIGWSSSLHAIQVEVRCSCLHSLTFSTRDCIRSALHSLKKSLPIWLRSFVFFVHGGWYLFEIWYNKLSLQPRL